MSPNAPVSRVLTLVFTDLADSTALKTQRGDAAVGELITRHRDHVTRLAQDCGGRIIDWAGDGCFLTFDTSSAGVLFALRLQETHHWESALPKVRVGVHMGEVTEKPFDGGVRVEGLIVDLTARISGLAAPGQVLLSGAVQQSARQRLGADAMSKPIRWETYGQYALKGFDEPVDVREAGLEGVSPFKSPAASEKARPVSAAGEKSGKKEIRKIAVLPFTSFSDAPEQDWFVDGMTETLIAELAKIKALTVISRTSVMHYKHTKKPLREIASELNADALVEGSVMRAGNRLRITAQLIDAESDIHLWADRYDGTMEEVLDVQANVALAIARQVNVALSPEDTAPMQKSRPVNPEAFERMMRARQLCRVPTIEAFDQAVALAEEAIAIDPEYAEAYAWLASIYSQHLIYGTVDADLAYRRGRIAALEAIRLDPNSSAAFSALGQLTRVTDWNWEKAAEYALRAAELDPGDSDAQTLCGLCSSYLGEFEKGEQFSRRAIEIDPLNPLAYMSLGSILLLQRRLDEIDDLIAKNIERFANQALLLLVSTMASLFRDDTASAVRGAEAGLEATGRLPGYLAIAGCCHALAGNSARTEAYLEELRKHASLNGSATGVATILQCLGRRDEAYPFFVQAYREREFALIYFNRIGFFTLAPFLDDERVQRLIARIGIK